MSDNNTLRDTRGAVLGVGDMVMYAYAYTITQQFGGPVWLESLCDGFVMETDPCRGLVQVMNIGAEDNVYRWVSVTETFRL